MLCFSGLIPWLEELASTVRSDMLSPGCGCSVLYLNICNCSASQTWFAKFFIVFPFWGVIRYNISYWFWNRFYSASKHLSEKPWTNHRKMWSCGTWSARISIAIGLWRVFFLVKVLLKVVLSMGNKQCRSRLLGSFLHWFSVQLNIRKTLAWAISL